MASDLTAFLYFSILALHCWLRQWYEFLCSTGSSYVGEPAYRERYFFPPGAQW